MAYAPTYDKVVTTETQEGETSAHVVPGHIDIEVVHIDVDTAVAVDNMVIDLSDTTAWPHTATGHIDIVYMMITINPDTTYSGDIELGFLTNVDATDGDFNGVYEIHMDKKQDSLAVNMNFGAFEMSLESAHWYGPITANDTAFQTDVTLVGPAGASHNSGTGDFVMRISRTAGEVAVGLTVGYRTHA